VNAGEPEAVDGWRLDRAGRTAVLVIDMQVDFASPDGCWARSST
jgi:isochorismate hydrolase